MAIFGFKKRKDEKLEQGAQTAKVVSDKKAVKSKIKSTKTAAITDAKKPDHNKMVVPVLHGGVESSSASVILRPRITEKSGILSQGGVYTFEVSSNANKAMVARAIKVLYKVSPVRVAMINTPMRNVFVKNRRGTVSGIRKAMVTLKKGDKIDFV